MNNNTVVQKMYEIKCKVCCCVQEFVQFVTEEHVICAGEVPYKPPNILTSPMGGGGP